MRKFKGSIQVCRQVPRRGQNQLTAGRVNLVLGKRKAKMQLALQPRRTLLFQVQTCWADNGFRPSAGIIPSTESYSTVRKASGSYGRLSGDQVLTVVDVKRYFENVIRLRKLVTSFASCVISTLDPGSDARNSRVLLYTLDGLDTWCPYDRTIKASPAFVPCYAHDSYSSRFRATRVVPGKSSVTPHILLLPCDYFCNFLGKCCNSLGGSTLLILAIDGITESYSQRSVASASVSAPFMMSRSPG